MNFETPLLIRLFNVLLVQAYMCFPTIANVAQNSLPHLALIRALWMVWIGSK